MSREEVRRETERLRDLRARADRDWAPLLAERFASSCTDRSSGGEDSPEQSVEKEKK
jgi:hypothetical protein